MKRSTALLSIVVIAAGGAWAETSAPSDPQIAAIVVAANQVDIDAANLAKSKSGSSQVKDFAQRMITDHSGVLKAAVDLVTKLKVTPESNPTSESLTKGGMDNITVLKKLSGAEFDRAYIDHEVTYHEAVIKAIDDTLIPNAKNQELKALLVKVEPAFVAHLDHAKSLQAALAKTSN
jgi:putative membrane protein